MFDCAKMRISRCDWDRTGIFLRYDDEINAISMYILEEKHVFLCMIAKKKNAYF